jgi:hypothetical protein
MRARAALLTLLGAAAVVSPAAAEPIFLARQYARCTTCHYSPTGGGLLTPYGRSLTREELSTMRGKSHGQAGATGPAQGEEGFLFGALGDTLGPVSVGIDLRPGHLDVRFPGGDDKRDLLMNADIAAAYQGHRWTVYGELGRQPFATGTRVDSWEHWLQYQTAGGLGIRAGRFLPAYGIRFADHTAFNRRPLGLDTLDQVYGLELSSSTDRHLLQVMASPGRADSIVHDDGRKAFNASGRFQYDVSPRTVLVASGLYRDKSDLEPSGGSGGLALGFALFRRLTIWTQGDVQFEKGSAGAAYVLVNETSFEAFRGVWLKVSPQWITDFGDTSGGTFRLALEANLLPRTHWNLDLSHYHDRGRSNGIVVKTTLLQLHLYL